MSMINSNLDKNQYLHEIGTPASISAKDPAHTVAIELDPVNKYSNSSQSCIVLAFDCIEHFFRRLSIALP